MELKLCQHKFHESCLEQFYENGNKVNTFIYFSYKITAIPKASPGKAPRGGELLHYKFIRGCAPQGFLLRPNPRNLVRY